jgi:hypothetical protein
MQFKNAFFLLFCFFSFSFFADAEVPKVRFYPQKELTFCKDCYRNFDEKVWRFKFKLENLSGKDLIVYGNQFEKDEFSFGYTWQYKNPNTCEWQYSYGSSENRCDWKCVPSSYKNKIILKPGEFIERSGDAVEDAKTPQRITAYVAANPDEDAYEIFSEPYLLVKSSDEKGTPVLKVVDEECTPDCNLSIGQSPSIHGIKLGMSLEDFKKVFPKARVSKSNEKNYEIKWAWLWDWNEEDGYDINLTFLDEKVVQIEVKFRSLKDTRMRTDFYQLVSAKIGLPYFWQPYGEKWECRDFLIRVLPNEIPTITIWNKAFIKVQEKIAEEDWKK